MTFPSALADKIALANTLAAYLHGTDFDLGAELSDRGLDIRAADGDFGRLLLERVGHCPDCNFWVAADAYCSCGAGADWEDEE